MTGAVRVNFNHPRLRVQAQHAWRRPGVLVAALVIVLLAVTGHLVFDWHQQRSAVDDLQAQLAAIKEERESARKNINRLNLARGWYDARPAMLESLRGVGSVIPESGQVWITNISVRENLSGTLAGKAQSERNAIEFLDRLGSDKRFSEVKLLYIRQADRNSRTASFALTFTYTALPDSPDLRRAETASGAAVGSSAIAATSPAGSMETSGSSRRRSFRR